MERRSDSAGGGTGRYSELVWNLNTLWAVSGLCLQHWVLKPVRVPRGDIDPQA